VDLFGPIGRGGDSFSGILQAAVKWFDNAIRLRVVGGGLAMPSVKHFAKLKPHI